MVLVSYARERGWRSRRARRASRSSPTSRVSVERGEDRARRARRGRAWRRRRWCPGASSAGASSASTRSSSTGTWRSPLVARDRRKRHGQPRAVARMNSKSRPPGAAPSEPTRSRHESLISSRSAMAGEITGRRASGGQSQPSRPPTRQCRLGSRVLGLCCLDPSRPVPLVRPGDLAESALRVIGAVLCARRLRPVRSSPAGPSLAPGKGRQNRGG